ncbi:MAG: ARMT1-like domain-containing protein [bacterium]
MRVVPECFPCLLRQAINTAKSAGADEAQMVAVLREAMSYMAQADLSLTPARFSEPVYAMVARTTGVADPYADMKQASNTQASKIMVDVRERVTQSHDPLAKALLVAAAGNVIDAGIGHQMDVRKNMKQLLHTPFAINDTPAFRTLLKRGARVLYVADNAGEIIFDALAVDRIQRLGVSVIVAVKSGPIINDATLEDARAAELTCTVIETGAASIGIDWARVSPEFRAAYQAADAVIAKGHGHFETLYDEPHPGLFFLLKAKCPVVAKSLRCSVGDLVFRHAPRLRSTAVDAPAKTSAPSRKK